MSVKAPASSTTTSSASASWARTTGLAPAAGSARRTARGRRRPDGRGRGRRDGPAGRWSVHPTSKRIDVPASDAADECERRNESTHRSRPCRAAVRCSTWRSRRRRRTSSGWCGRGGGRPLPEAPPARPGTGGGGDRHRRGDGAAVAERAAGPRLGPRRAVAPAGRRRPRGRRSRGNVRTVTNRRRRTPPSPLRRVRLRPPRALPLSDDAQDPDRQRGRREHGPHHPPDEPSLQVREADAGRGRPPPAASCRATAIVWYVFRCRPRPVGVGTARRGDIFRPGMHFSLDSSRGGGSVRIRQRTRNSPQAVCGGAGPPPRAGTVFFVLREPSAGPESRTSP